MATPTAGSSLGVTFPSAKFRDAIKFAMQMGAPTEPTEQVIFFWPASHTHNAGADLTGKPYDLAASPTSTVAERRVHVDCAVEFIGRPGTNSPTAMGEFNESSVKLTLLDVDYEQVEGAPRLIVDGSIYVLDYVAPPVGLFDVTVYQIYASAQDES